MIWGSWADGPVYGLDDDNKILPGLFSLLVKVERIGVIPVGNLGGEGWEAPGINDFGDVVEPGDRNRKYGFDYGGYTFNSSLLGTQISGAAFWKHTTWGGESEFFEQVIGHISDVEPLCGRDHEQDCHFVWHNEPLSPTEAMTDDEELAFIRKYGGARLFKALGFERKESS